MVNKIESISIEITDRCNLICKHCSTEASPSNEGYMEFDLFRKVLYSGKEFGARYLSLSGGEPLLHSNFMKMVNEAVKLNYEINVYTSGVLGDNESIGNEMLSFLRNNVSNLIFSVFSDSSDIHDYITEVEGSFETTITSIKRALEFGIDTELHTVPMAINYKRLPAILKLASDLGIDMVSLLRLVPQGRCVENKDLIMSKKESKELKAIVNELEIDEGKPAMRKGAPYKCLFINEADSCSAAEDKILISTNGDVHPCEAFKSDKTVSNIKENDLYDIWENDKRLMQLRKSNINDISNCSSCGHLEVCKGGCPGQRWLRYDDMITGPDPGCIEYAVR